MDKVDWSVLCVGAALIIGLLSGLISHLVTKSIYEQQAVARGHAEYIMTGINNDEIVWRWK